VDKTRFLRFISPLVLAGVYFAASKLGFSVAYDAEQVTLVWPPTGIALAAVLVWGYRMWPGIALGAFLANVTTNEPVLTATTIALGNTLEAVIAGWLLRRAWFHTDLGQVKDVLALLLYSAIASTMLSATIGVTSLCLGGVQPWDMYWPLWRTWWLGDAAGALIFAPPLLVWARHPAWRWSPARVLEGLLLATIFLIICTGIFTDPMVAGIRGSTFTYFIFPCLIVAALRFGQHGTTFITLAAAVIAIWATVHGFGPFIGVSISHSLALLQIFMPVVAVTGLLLSAAINERNEAGMAKSHMAAIIASSEDAIIGKNLHNIVNFWNASAERMFGYEAYEIVGRSTMIMVPPELREEERKVLERLRRGERIEHYETKRITKDGRVLDVSISASPIHDAVGHIVGVSKVVRDISERKWAQDILRESEARFRLMADTAPVLIWMAGVDKKCDYLNKPWLDFTGCTMEQELGDGWVESVHPEDRERCLGTYRTAFDARQPFEMEYRLRHHTGDYRWLLVRGTPRFTSHGQFTGYIGSCVDITMRKEMENALKESDRRKDEFLATLAHELRNPLAPLKGALQLLKQSESDSARRNEAKEIMENQLNQMVRLVDDLLDVSRISHGKIELLKKPMPLADAVGMALETVLPLAEAKGHRLTIDLPKETLWLDADGPRLAQVFANLLNNAVKYTEPGGIIRLEGRVKGNAVEVTIGDNGIGIPAEMLPTIFDMFTQVDTSVERSQGGLGIGLTLVKNLVSLHGGSVRAESKGVRQGSVFTVTLPLASSPAAAELKPQIASASPERKLRVLVVDDNRNLAKTLGWMVEILGHEAKIVCDGKEVIATAEEYLPDAILLDIGLSGMNGYDLAKEIRKHPKLKHCLLIAQTGWGQPEHRRRSKEAGFDHHLVKPVEMETLAQLFTSKAFAA